MAVRAAFQVSARAAVLLLGVLLLAHAALAPAATTPATLAPAVAAPDRYSAEVAAEVLRNGGNAVDAAVAVAFVLAVTYPEAGNLGGGGFATVYFEGHSYFLDYRECAPASATAGMYLDARGEVIADASTVGAGAAGVPGTVEGLWQLHRRFARRSWNADLAPAVRLAHEGFQVGRMQQATRDARAAELHGRTNFLAYFGALSAGATLRQPELEATLRRIAAHGSDGFYRGRTAELISRRDGARPWPRQRRGPGRLPRRVARAAERGLGRLPGHHRAAAQLRGHCPAVAAGDEGGPGAGLHRA